MKYEWYTVYWWRRTVIGRGGTLSTSLRGSVGEDTGFEVEGSQGSVGEHGGFEVQLSEILGMEIPC